MPSESDSTNAAAEKQSANPPENLPKTPWLLLLLPFAILVPILLTSPNFRWTEDLRSDPYGSDFLQEWIGGQTILSSDRSRLYEPEFTKSRQHDEANVGFTWPEDNYFPMVYPPFYYFLVSPFSLIEYRWAAMLWALFSCAALSLTGLIAFRFYPPSRNAFAIWFVAAAIFVPWLSCLTMGQKSGLLLLLFLATFLLKYNRRSFWAGVVFGLVAIKPHLGIVIGAAMIWKRDWQFVLGSAVSVGALVGLSWLFAPQLCADYLQVVAGMSDYVQTGGYQLADSHNLWGAAQLTLSAFDPAIVKFIVIGISTIVTIFVAWMARGNTDNITTANASRKFALLFAALVLTTILLSPHFYSYDLTLAILPMMLVLTQIGFQPSSSLEKWALGLIVGLYALAGSFPKIADVIHFQPSLIFTGGLIFVLLRLYQQVEGVQELDESDHIVV